MKPQDIEAQLRKALGRAKRSARSRGRRFDLTIEFLRKLWNEQGGRCAVSGIAFTAERHDEAFVKTPFGPSIDRIDNTGGYTADNVRLVCMVANFAMNQWSDDVLRRLAHGVAEIERKEERAWFDEQHKKLQIAQQNAERLTGKQLKCQKNIIAGLKRSITMGPARLRGAARKAIDTRLEGDTDG